MSDTSSMKFEICYGNAKQDHWYPAAQAVNETVANVILDTLRKVDPLQDWKIRPLQP